MQHPQPVPPQGYGLLKFYAVLSTICGILAICLGLVLLLVGVAAGFATLLQAIQIIVAGFLAIVLGDAATVLLEIVERLRRLEGARLMPAPPTRPLTESKPHTH